MNCRFIYLQNQLKLKKYKRLHHSMLLLKRTAILIFLLLHNAFYGQTALLSWNLENFGKSKSDSEINFIANTLKSYDILAIQEVVAGPGGAQAVARLVDELNRKGSKWDYVVSDPTSSSANKKERYAFIWKTAKIKKIGKAWLEKKYHLEIDCTQKFRQIYN